MEQETSRRSRKAPAADPWVRRLLVAVLVMLVFVLTAVIYVVYTGVLTGQAPRTLAEKEIATLDRSFKATPNDPTVVAQYMRALIEVERYSKATSVMNAYRAAESTASAVVSIEEARLLDATGDSEGALGVAERALTEAQAEKQATIDKQAAMGITSPFSSEEIVDAWLLRAQILEGLDRVDEAIAALDGALEELPTMADVLAWRGDLESSVGDTAAARADYEKALSMIPDFQQALEGLSALERGGSDE
ncbi:MAG: hypothetical protein JXE06_01140 [Coriobacteriia bacterium]|nr:hypothetical protein [Coriobacteriia bacterium]MBN2822465.1 hypothetical protein [Coriobacteriia bacterium]